MKSFLLICTILALAVCSMQPKELLSLKLSPFKKVFTKERAITKSYNPFNEEDVKYCGTYEGSCSSEEMVSTKMGVKILGMMHKNPIYMYMMGSIYMGGDCQEAQKLYDTTMDCAVNVANSVTKQVEIVTEKVHLEFFSEFITSSLTCAEPLELHKVYDVTELDCKDMSGEDPFKDIKEVIGVTVPEEIVFAEKYMKLEDEEIPRTSDVGCTCASSMIKEASSVMKKMASVKREKNEDIKYCGGYSTGCISSPLMSMQSDATVMGMMHKNPIYLQYPVAMYLGEQCTVDSEMMVLAISGPLDVKNDVKKTVDFTYEKGTVKFTNEMMISSYTCSEPLELNKEYDITKLDCKDQEGKDPFADMKEQIGQVATINMTFGEKSMSLEMEESDPLIYERVDDTGCHCAKNLRCFCVC